MTTTQSAASSSASPSASASGHSCSGPSSGEQAAELGRRALHYVQEEIRYLSSIRLTPEGEHALLCWRIMLRTVWRKELRDGRFVFLDDAP